MPPHEISAPHRGRTSGRATPSLRPNPYAAKTANPAGRHLSLAEIYLDNTRPALTSASSDTLGPFGKLISIAPRRGVRCASRDEFVLTSAGGRALAAPNSTSFNGTKLDPITSDEATAPGFSFTGTRRRFFQPSRERHIHLNTRLAFNPCRRATAATDTPGASASSTIRLRSSRLRVCRRASTPTCAAIRCPHQI